MSIDICDFYHADTSHRTLWIIVLCMFSHLARTTPDYVCRTRRDEYKLNDKFTKSNIDNEVTLPTAPPRYAVPCPLHDTTSHHHPTTNGGRCCKEERDQTNEKSVGF